MLTGGVEALASKIDDGREGRVGEDNAVPDNFSLLMMYNRFKVGYTLYSTGSNGAAFKKPCHHHSQH